MPLPEPFCHFCRRRNSNGTYSFDYDEWHAICLGLLLPVPMWWPICRWNVGDAARLLASESWYVALGTTLRLLATLGILIFWRCF